MAPRFNDSVGSEIRAEMARQRLTQTDLAERLDWSQVAVSRRLSGAVALSTDEIEQVAATLNVPVGQLVSPAPERAGA